MTKLIQTDETVKETYNLAGRIAKRALDKMNVAKSATDHYVDLIQSIALTLLECHRYKVTGQEYLAYALRAGYNTAIEYIIEHIFKGKRLHEKATSTEHARQQYRYIGMTAAYIQLSKNMKARQVPRPVEDSLLVDEAAHQRFWAAVERQFFEVLAGMRQRGDTKGLTLQASALCLSCQGYSAIAISIELRINETHAYQLLRKARATAEAFLALPAITQGVIQARGRLRNVRPHELTHEVMNSGVSYQVAFPHGQFTVEPRGTKMRVVRTMQRNGRKKQVAVTISVEIGHITYEHVYEASAAAAARLKQAFSTD